jgi:hypothetical protein
MAWRSQARRRQAWAAAVAGALAGAAIAVKVTFAAPAAGLAAGLWRARAGPDRAGPDRAEPDRTGMLASGIAGCLLMLVAGYLIVGRQALESLTQRLSSATDSFLPLPAPVFHNAAAYIGISAAALLLVGGLLAWRMPTGHDDLPEIRPVMICALAVVLGGIVQYPWYDAMIFPFLALLPASRLDAWLTGRITLISCVVLPGIAVKDFQYREARVLVPVFMIAFLIALAAGKVFTAPKETG